MDKQERIIFTDFARKAKERIEAKKMLKTKQLYIPDLDETITIRALTDQEIIDCSEYSDDNEKNDRYLIYMACKELQEIAGIMVENGDIEEHIEVIQMFSGADKKSIARKILELSGIYDESTIKEVDEIKN